MDDVELRPLTGSPEHLRAGVDVLTAAVSALVDARRSGQDVTATLADQHSEAVGLALERVDRVLARAATTARVLESAAQTLRGHAAALTSAQDDALRAILRHDEAEHDRARWALVAAEARQASWLDPFGPTAPAAMERVRAATARQDEAGAAVGHAEQEWRAARDRKRDASARAAAAIEPLSDRHGLTRYLVAGESILGFRASWERADQAVDLLRALTPGRDGAVLTEAGRTAALAGLARLLETAEGDEVFWSRFHTQTTLPEVYDLFSRLPGSDGPGGAGDAERSALVVGAVSAGFGTWTQTLDPLEQRAAGARAVDAATPPPERGLEPWSAWAALLLGARAVPQGVHLGAAERLDHQGRLPGAPGTGGTWRVDAPQAVELAERLGLDEHDADLEIAVLRGLARSETAALDFFSPIDPALGQERVTRWLGTATANGWPDGGAALADALRQAVVTGEASDVVGHQRRAALLAAQATVALPGGLLLQPLSDEAVVHVIDTYVPYLGSLDVAIDLTGTHVDPATTREVAVEKGAGTKAIVPLLDPASLRHVIATTGRPDAGADRWNELSEAHLLRMLEVTFGPGETSLSDTEQASAVHLMMRDLAVIGGSLAHRGVLDGERRDRIAADRVALLGAGISRVPYLGQVAELVTEPLAHVVEKVVLSTGVEVTIGFSQGHFEKSVADAVAQGADEYELAAMGAYHHAVVQAVERGATLESAAERYRSLLPLAERPAAAADALLPESDALQHTYTTVHRLMSGVDHTLGEPHALSSSEHPGER